MSATLAYFCWHIKYTLHIVFIIWNSAENEYTHIISCSFPELKSFINALCRASFQNCLEKILHNFRHKIVLKRQTGKTTALEIEIT